MSVDLTAAPATARPAVDTLSKSGIIAAGVGLASLPLHLGLVALMVAWLLLASLMPGRSFVRRALYSLVALYAGNAAVLTAFAVARVPCNPAWIVAGYLVMGFAISTRRRPQIAPLSRTDDRWALGLGLVAFCVVARDLVFASTARVLGILSETTDPATHIHLIRAIMRQRGYVTFASQTGLDPGVNLYPPGWAGNVWFFVELGWGRHVGPFTVVRLTALAAVFGYAVLVALLTLLAMDLLPERTPRAGAIALLAPTVLCGFVIFFVHAASYSQIWALNAILVVLLLIGDRAVSATTCTALAAAAAVVLAQSWYLLAPMVGAVALVLVAERRPARRVVVAWAVVAAPFCVFPILTGPDPVAHLKMHGPATLPTITGVVGLLIATAAGLAVLMTRRLDDRGQVLGLAATIVAGLFVVLFLAVTGPEGVRVVSYYNGKVLLSVFLFGTIAAAATWGGQRLLFALAVVGVIAGLIGARDEGWPPGPGIVSKTVDEPVFAALVASHPRGITPDTDVWVVDGCDQLSDLVSSKWMYDISLAWSQARYDAAYAYAFARSHPMDELQKRLADPTLKTMELYVGHQCHPQEVAQLATNPKVHVIKVDAH